jgi:hypothetical protein
MDTLGQIFGDAVQGYQTYVSGQTAQHAAPAQAATAQSQAQQSTNWTTFALIGGGILAFIIVIAVAFRK